MCQHRLFTWLLFSVFTAGPYDNESSPIRVRMTKVRPSPNGEPELSSFAPFQTRKRSEQRSCPGHPWRGQSRDLVVGTCGDLEWSKWRFGCTSPHLLCCYATVLDLILFARACTTSSPLRAGEAKIFGGTHWAASLPTETSHEKETIELLISKSH